MLVSLLEEVSRTPSVNLPESGNAAILGDEAFLLPDESPPPAVRGSELSEKEDDAPEKKKSALTAAMTMPSRKRRSLITESLLTNMDVLIGFTTGIEKTVNCPRA